VDYHYGLRHEDLLVLNISNSAASAFLGLASTKPMNIDLVPVSILECKGDLSILRVILGPVRP
jgi:hypothetical protein